MIEYALQKFDVIVPVVVGAGLIDLRSYIHYVSLLVSGWWRSHEVHARRAKK